ncbi:MAG: hypothetical protein ACE5HO_11355 [bacterium]
MSFHFPWSSYSKFNARWNGRKDDKAGIPLVEQEQHAPYELELQKLAEENIRRVAQRWEDMDKKLKSEYCKAEYQRETAEGAHTPRDLIQKIYGKAPLPHDRHPRLLAGLLRRLRRGFEQRAVRWGVVGVGGIKLTFLEKGSFCAYYDIGEFVQFVVKFHKSVFQLS